MGEKKKKAIVSVSNDLFTDQRVDRTCSVLLELGYEVLLVGRLLPQSPPLKPRSYQTKRMNLLFRQGALFYAELNIRLFFLLLFKPQTLLYSNDLDTLLANFLAAKIKRKTLIYDSHEYFTEMPELENAFAKKFWKAMEKWILPKIKNNITVGEMIASIYKKKYGQEFTVIRNVPQTFKPNKNLDRQSLSLPLNKSIIILQGGGINKDRGAEEMIAAMDYLPNVLLIFLGGGDQMEDLKRLSKDKIDQKKILFIPRQTYDRMMSYTVLADIGLSLEKSTNLNMEYSLPNKVFEYIQAGIPVLSTNLIEKQKLILHYQVGELIEDLSPQNLANKIRYMLEDKEKRIFWKENIEKARHELSWDREKEKLKRLILSSK